MASEQGVAVGRTRSVDLKPVLVAPRRHLRREGRASRPARAWLTYLRVHLVEVVQTDVLARELDRPLRTTTLAPGLQIRQLGAEEPWREVFRRDQWAHVRPFFARGDQGFVALLGEQPVGWVWLSRVSHRDPWSGLVIRLAPGEAYAYDLWCAEQVRSLGVPAALIGTLLSAAHDAGASRVYGWVDRRTRESAVLLRMLGFQDVQTVQRVHLLRRRGWMRPGSDRPPYGPLSEHGRHTSTGMGQT